VREWSFPRVEESITRGHRFKMQGARFKGDVRGEVVEAGTIVTFKGRLDKHMDRMGIEGYGPRRERVLVQTGSMIGAGLEG